MRSTYLAVFKPRKYPELVERIKNVTQNIEGVKQNSELRRKEVAIIVSVYNYLFNIGEQTTHRSMGANRFSPKQ